MRYIEAASAKHILLSTILMERRLSDLYAQLMNLFFVCTMFLLGLFAFTDFHGITANLKSFRWNTEYVVLRTSTYYGVIDYRWSYCPIPVFRLLQMPVSFRSADQTRSLVIDNFYRRHITIRLFSFVEFQQKSAKNYLLINFKTSLLWCERLLARNFKFSFCVLSAKIFLLVHSP
jgi:hypothetical protein